ncbi:MAG: hypothetical protein AAB490_04700 [Patescibacteria group bacterium]
MDKRRILLVIAFILSVLVFGFLLYYFFFRDLGGPESLPNINAGNGVLPTPINGNISVVGNENRNVNLPDFGDRIDLDAPKDVAQGGLTNVSDYGSFRAENFVSTPVGTYFYDRQASQFFSLDGDRIVPLSNEKFYNVEDVTWSKDLKKAVLEYPDGSNIVYDFATKRQVTLPQELTDFSFDTSGKAIAGKWFGDNDEENWLMVSGADGSNLRLVEPIGDQANDVRVDFSPDSQIVALYRKPANANYQTVLPIGLRGENFRSFDVPGLKFESKWSPLGNALLYNVTTAENDYKPELWLTTGTNEVLGTTHLDLKLTTRAEKCTFDSTGNSIYCAQPVNLERGAGLYPEIAVGTPDTFYRIDLRSGQKIPLAIPVGTQATYSAESVFLSSDESLLYFVDGSTQQLHSIRLK